MNEPKKQRKKKGIPAELQGIIEPIPRIPGLPEDQPAACNDGNCGKHRLWPNREEKLQENDTTSRTDMGDPWGSTTSEREQRRDNAGRDCDSLPDGKRELLPEEPRQDPIRELSERNASTALEAFAVSAGEKGLEKVLEWATTRLRRSRSDREIQEEGLLHESSQAIRIQRVELHSLYSTLSTLEYHAREAKKKISQLLGGEWK